MYQPRFMVLLATAGIPDRSRGTEKSCLLMTMIVNNFLYVLIMLSGAGSLHCLLSLSLVATIVWIPFSESSFLQFACKMPKHSSGWSPHPNTGFSDSRPFVFKRPTQVSSLSGEGRTQASQVAPTPCAWESLDMN